MPAGVAPAHSHTYLTSQLQARIFGGPMSHESSSRPRRSAGVLLYRKPRSGPDATPGPHTLLEVYLVHPGGPYFRSKDIGGIAKGLVEDGENEETAARREF